MSIILATLIYLRKDNQTLMVFRNKKPGDIHAGKWNGLGGKFMPGESPEECVIREVREESGLEIGNPHLHGLIMFPGFKGNDWYVFVFTAESPQSELVESDEGLLKWIPDTDLEKLPLWESDHIFFQWLKQDKFFSGKFVYLGEKLAGHEVVFH